MIKINDNLYINEENVSMPLKLNGEYYVKLRNGNLIAITEEIYNQLVGDNND